MVRVVFDPKAVDCAAPVKLFLESHDPTQGMRQGNDIGTQYRSGIYVANPEQRRVAEAAKASCGKALTEAGHRGTIATEILDAAELYHAEDCHQQYLARNPNGYCGLVGTGVPCPVGLRAAHRRAD